MKNITEEDLAYLAGFVDGEGCFFIGYFKTKSAATGKPGENYHTILKISNTHLGVLEWIKSRFGGLLRGVNRPMRKCQIVRPVYDLVFSGDTLTDLTIALLPFLILKKPHAKVMLKMRKTFPRGRSRGQTPVTDRTKAIRQTCFIEIRNLNSRFSLHPLKQN